MGHADEAFTADEFRVGIVCLVECELAIDEALRDVIDDAVLEGAVALQPPWVFVVPHADGLGVPGLVFGVGVPACDVHVVHAAVVEGGSLVFVPFSGGESGRHVADADDGELADFSASDKILHDLRVPGIAEVEVDGAELVGRFFELDDVPLFAEFVGEGFFADDVLAGLYCLLDSACPGVGQCEKTDALHFGVIPDIAFVGSENGLRSYLV